MAGTASKLALVKGGTWGTAVSLGTGHRVPFERTTLRRNIEQIANETILGKATRAPSDNGNEETGGAVIVAGDYRQHLLQAAAFMGTAGVPTTVESGVYLHVFPFTAAVDGLFLSAGVDYGGVDVHGFNSLKCMRRFIECRAGDKLRETYDYIGRGLDKTLTSSGWTYANDPNQLGARHILHRHGVWRMNAAAGDALAAGDKVYPTAFTVDINRALAGSFADAALMEEPIPDGWAAITVQLTFDHLTAALIALLLDSRDAGTLLKLDTVFTYPTKLGATEYPHRAFYFPSLKVVDMPLDIPGAGKLPATVTLEASYATADPTGFPTGYNEEMTEEAQCGVSTNPLA